MIILYIFFSFSSLSFPKEFGDGYFGASLEMMYLSQWLVENVGSVTNPFFSSRGYPSAPFFSVFLSCNRDKKFTYILSKSVEHAFRLYSNRVNMAEHVLPQSAGYGVVVR